jgi:hypothetical protein
MKDAICNIICKMWYNDRMKLLTKVFIASVSPLIIGGTVAVIAIPHSTPAVTKSVDTTVVADAPTVTPTPVDTTPTTTVAPVETAPITPVIVPAPILSVNEYAQKYLDMTAPHAQECLDSIVTTWPDRFVESVREKDVKALTRWKTDLCTAGIYTNTYSLRHSGNTVLPLTSFGMNGEYFDSHLADQYNQ